MLKKTDFDIDSYRLLKTDLAVDYWKETRTMYVKTVFIYSF